MRRMILPTILLAMLVLSACGGAKPASAPAATEGAKRVPATQEAVRQAAKPAATSPAAEEPAATEVPAATEQPASAGTEDTLSLASREAGLDKLKSYRMHWQADWNSTEVTKTEVSNWDWTEEYSADPKALHWIWKTADALKKGQGMELWQIGDTTYMKNTDASGKDGCTSFSSDDQQSQLQKGGIFSPSLLGSLSDAKYVGNEAVNGVPAKHYQYDQKAGSLLAFGKVNGDIWVASDGGYVVKDTMSWQGGAGLLGASSSAKGDGKWVWELSNVNQPMDIKAPENCGGAAKGLPIMKDATEKSSMGDLVIYKSASKVADVLDFYKKEMPAAGWQLEGEPEVTGEDLASITFIKGGDKATVQITNDSGKSQVMVNVQKGQ
jgi:hypothetical protein